MRMNWRTCYWYFSNSCKTKKCRSCIYHLPVLKGLVKKTDFEKYKRDVGIQTLYDYFIKKVTPPPPKPKKVPSLPEETKKRILQELDKLDAVISDLFEKNKKDEKIL